MPVRGCFGSSAAGSLGSNPCLKMRQWGRYVFTEANTVHSLLEQSTGRVCIKVKVKCTLVQALRLCTGRTAHRGSRGIALPFHDHGTRRGWGVSVTPRPLCTPGKDPVPIVQEAGWAPGPVWKGAENLAPTGIRSPDRPARSQSLYRLRYPAHWCMYTDTNIIWANKARGEFRVHACSLKQQLLAWYVVRLPTNCVWCVVSAGSCY